jgi:acyl-CoA synthetase (AMP-forming)/AMP-acid ligase II
MIDHNAIRFMGDIPAAQRRARPDSLALKSATGAISYRELAERVGLTMAALEREGVRAGDRISWIGANGSEWFEAFFATIGLRACFMPLNIRLNPAELAYMLEDSGTRLLLVGPGECALAEAAVSQLAAPPRIMTIGFDQPGHDRLALTGDPREPDEPQASDDIFQLYTSGTTGRPKGVRLTNGNYAAFLQYSPRIEGFDYESHETVLIVMPLFHVAGTNVSLAGLAHGCRVIVEQAFDPARVLRLIEEESVAQVFLAPTLIRMLLEAPEIEGADLSSLRTVGYGASPIPESLLAAAQARMGCQFTQYYGMTESSGSGTYLAPRDHRPELLRSCGKSWPGVEAKIMRPDGSDAEAGEVGEIVISGPTVSPGYWQRDEATAETIRDGWLHTGDAGYADENGYLFVHDRIKDMIVSGGENVYPAEVENAIAGCPGVGDVAVIAVPSERWGEEVRAVIVPAPGAKTDADAVIAWAKDRIAGYKVPKSIEFVDELPRNASGKVLRRELRDRHWQGMDRTVG